MINKHTQPPVQVSKTREELPTTKDGGDEAPHQSNPPLPNTRPKARPLTSSSMVDPAADGYTDHGPRVSSSRSLEHNNEVRKLLYIFLSCLRNSIPFAQMASDKGQESPRKRKGRNTGTTATAVPKRQKVGQGQGSAQPMTRRSQRAPRLTERAKEAW